MEKSLKIKSLYSSLEEGEYANSIISYTKNPYLISYRDVPVDLSSIKAGEVVRLNEVEKVTQYKKYLVIDLWLVVIRLSWLTKIKE